MFVPFDFLLFCFVGVLNDWFVCAFVCFGRSFSVFDVTCLFVACVCFVCVLMLCRVGFFVGFGLHVLV